VLSILATSLADGKETFAPLRVKASAGIVGRFVTQTVELEGQ